MIDYDAHKCCVELADKVRVTLIEALPNVLPMFSKVIDLFFLATIHKANYMRYSN